MDISVFFKTQIISNTLVEKWSILKGVKVSLSWHPVVDFGSGFSLVRIPIAWWHVGGKVKPRMGVTVEALSLAFNWSLGNERLTTSRLIKPNGEQ
jgi:hypothetical protein